MNDIFFFTDYRSFALKAATAAVTILLFLAGFVPSLCYPDGDPTVLGFMAIGFILAGLAFWLFENRLSQSRALDLHTGVLVDVIIFLKWDRVRVLEDLDRIAVVYVKPMVDMWSRNGSWIYPVVAVTQDGREIVLANDSNAYDRENYSIPLAQKLAKEIGCDVHWGDGQTPLEVRANGDNFKIQVKREDVGIWGRFLVLALFGMLIWGLLALMA